MNEQKTKTMISIFLGLVTLTTLLLAGLGLFFFVPGIQLFSRGTYYNSMAWRSIITGIGIWFGAALNYYLCSIFAQICYDTCENNVEAKRTNELLSEIKELLKNKQ